MLDWIYSISKCLVFLNLDNFTGMDTTGNSLAFLMYNLSANQEAQEKLRREIIDVIGDGPVNKTHLEKMPYLTACIKENFRRFPISHTNLRILGP